MGQLFGQGGRICDLRSDVERWGVNSGTEETPVSVTGNMWTLGEFKSVWHSIPMIGQLQEQVGLM